MNNTSTNSLQPIPSDQPIDFALNGSPWPLIPSTHPISNTTQQPLTSLPFTNNQSYDGDPLFSPVDNSNWKIYADVPMNLASNQPDNTYQPLICYTIPNDPAMIQSQGIFASPQSTTCYGMENKRQELVSTSTTTLCNQTEDGTSSCTSSVVEDTYLSDGEMGVNACSSMVDHLLNTQLIHNDGKHEGKDDAPLQNDHTTTRLQEHETDQDQETHYCRWANCSFEGITLNELIAHIRDSHIGSGKAAYHCEWSGCTRNRKPFMKRHKMHNHMRTHTGERPFECTVDGCGKRFSRPDSLNTHMRTHSNIRPYMCPVADCCKAYFHSRSLRKHVKGHEAAGIIVPRSTSNNKRKTASPRPSSPLLQEHHEDGTVSPPSTSTSVPSSTPPLSSSCNDHQVLLFNSPSSPPLEWNPSSRPSTSTAPLYGNPQQQHAPLDYPSTVQVSETPTSISIYNPPMTAPNYTGIPLKSPSYLGDGSFYPSTSCAFYGSLSLSYAPH